MGGKSLISWHNPDCLVAYLWCWPIPRKFPDLSIKIAAGVYIMFRQTHLMRPMEKPWNSPMRFRISQQGGALQIGKLVNMYRTV